MIPSTSRRSAVPEANKPQAAAPNFVLSLLAACSSSVPAAGKEGEATFSEQLSGLLQDKPMDVGELNLIYSYRFGFSIRDALKFIGFDGEFQDFIIKQKRFSIHEGLVSLAPVDVTICEDYIEEPAVDEPLAPNARTEDGHEEIASITKNESEIIPETKSIRPEGESDVDVHGWHGVGSRLVAVLGSPEQDCCETASIAPTESTTDDGDSDAENDVDIAGWHSVGGRLIAALGSPEPCEGDIDVDAWKVLGGRIASTLDDDEGADVEGWRDVSSRIAAACKRSCDDDLCEDPIPDVAEWHAVGARVLQCFDNAE